MELQSLYCERWRSARYEFNVVTHFFRQWVDYEIEHKHNQVELMYVTQGSCTAEIGGKTVELHKHDFILIDASVTHRFVYESSCRLLNVEFVFAKSMSAFPSFLELYSSTCALQQFISLARPFVTGRDPDELYLALKSLVIEVNGDDPDRLWMIQLLMAQILIRLARLVAKYDALNVPSSSAYVGKAKDYLYANYDRNIQLSDVANSVGIHEGHLGRIFKQHTSCSVIEFLTQIRLERAKDLLRNTDIPVVELCQCVGLNSRQYFAQVFKKHVGMSPSAYRQQMNMCSF